MNFSSKTCLKDTFQTVPSSSSGENHLCSHKDRGNKNEVHQKVSVGGAEKKWLSYGDERNPDSI